MYTTIESYQTAARNVAPPSREFRIFMDAGEPFAAGLFERPNDPMPNRYAKAIRRYFESAPPVPPCDGARLYPAGRASVWTMLPEMRVAFHYSYSLSMREGLSERLQPHCHDAFAQQSAARAVDEIRHYCFIPIPGKFSIGGAGWTHCIINYKRILREGLCGYRARLEANSIEYKSDPNRVRFLGALLETLDAIVLYHAKCLEHIQRECHLATGETKERLSKLAEAFTHAPMQPASSFYEAMVALNFLWNLDGCDSVGRFDEYMRPYFEADLKAHRITEACACDLLSELWANFDANDGWHLLLGGAGTEAESHFTELCIRTMARFRRPNAGICIGPDSTEDVWNAMFDGWLCGAVNPSMYNQAAYTRGIASLRGVTPELRAEFAFGGCTELMFQGASNVGSIDAGINILQILERSLGSHLDAPWSFDGFMALFKRDVVAELNAAIDASNLNQRYMAQFRPQLIRSLLVDDCIERGVEFNAGGAVVNGSVINVAGLTNAINALLILKMIDEGRLEIARDSILSMLDANFVGYQTQHAAITSVKKFGNACKELDAIAQNLSSLVFQTIKDRKAWRGDGYCIPSIILFTTYPWLGSWVGASLDGRKTGDPLADSAGAMQGSDLEGPTSLLASCASLRHDLGTGTLVLNLRLDPSILKTPSGRTSLKALILTYFKMGGLQLQVTAVDPAILREAIKDPQRHPNLLVRIGGYSEYFNRLAEDLKLEVLKRIAHD